MFYTILLLLLLLLFLSPSPAPAKVSASNTNITLSGCSGICGTLSIPFPFGTSSGCYLPGLRITCNTSYSPAKPFISTTDLEITDISLDGGTVTVLGPVARDCYKPLNLGPDIPSTTTDISSLPFAISYTRNMFTAVGCDAVALNYKEISLDFSTGCYAFCPDPTSLVNGTCGGVGCCHTAIPKGLKRIDTMIRSLWNHTTTWNYSPCSYAFLADQEKFVFNVADLRNLYKTNRMQMVLDWAIGDQFCEQVRASENYACGENSFCVNSTNGPGYRCSCLNGYQGNPYLPNGCQDVDECGIPAINPCSHICTNTEGSYQCFCPHGFHGDGKKNGRGCIQNTGRFPVTQVVLGAGLSSLFIVVGGSWLYWGLKKRRVIKLKERYFIQNRGMLMEQKLSSEARGAARIFTAEELEKATDKYSDSRIIGRGGYGVVYKGILPDNRIVAIKKSRINDQSQIEQFINEVVILSQVIHRNVVRILGCCVETEVPLLVYEYVANGTLHQHIHGNSDRSSSLSWESRLRIAAETAGALAYLHSATARSIFHRDVKSANILLDENFNAKVSDFGASRLIPLDRNQITTLVQGTLGYLDPEYFQTGILTEKSDVYSFGVVLAELLTSRKPISLARTQEEQNLAVYFLLSLRENRLVEILDARVRNEGSRGQVMQVAELTKSCLRLRGEERPTMIEVAGELERAMRRADHFFDRDDEENGVSQSLLRESSMAITAYGSARTMSVDVVDHDHDESSTMYFTATMVTGNRN